MAPAGDGAPQAADLGWARVVLEIDAELGDELNSEFGVVDVVDRSDDFLSDNRPSALGLVASRVH